MSGIVVLAAGLAALAVQLGAPRHHARSLRLAGAGRGNRRLRVLGTTGGLLGLVALGVTSAAGPSVARLCVSLLAAGVLMVTVRTMVLGNRRREARQRRRHEVIEVCDALVAEMQAGLPAQLAVTNACRPWPELGGVVATARLGGDVAGALVKAAQRPGAEGLRLLAAGWQVSGRSGAGLAAVLDRIAASLRADEEAHAEVVAALGPPRASARLLATLPVVGLVLGTAMGVEPLSFLFTTGVGNACLLAGVGLGMIGLWWVERLADAVES